VMSDCEKLLLQIASEFGCKIWVCEKIGRRISYIQGLKAGEERYLPAQVVFENERYAVMCEIEHISKKLMLKAKRVIECVQKGHLSKDTQKASQRIC